jgi:hypothetical protein
MATALRATRLPRAAASAATKRRLPSALHPLDVAYTRAGLEPPTSTPIGPDEIPQPYRSLLVHQRDMTLTLEAHFGGRVALRPLSTFTSGPWYYRRVLLAQEYSGRPVEMGAIRMKLAALPRKVQAEIRRNRVPLGRLLRDAGVDFTSMPREFFAVEPNAEMMGVFWMREPRTLYGRRTEVLLDGKVIGDIVEVLPLV